MYCTACGGELPPSTTSCGNCGSTGGASPPVLPSVYAPRRRYTATGPIDMGETACLAWCIVLFVLGAAVYAAAHPGAPVSEMVGGAMAGGLLGAVFAGIGRLFGHRRPRRVVVVGWSIALVLSAIGQFSELADHARGRQAREQALTHLEQATQAFNARQPIPAVPAPTDPGALAADPQASMLHQIDDLATGYIRQASQIRQQIHALHLQEVGEPRRMVSAAGIAGGELALDKYAVLLDQQDRLLHGYLSNLRGRLEQYPEPMRTGALKGFDASATKGLPLLERQVSLERESIATLRSILAIARANLGHTRAEGNVFYLPQGAVADYQAAVGHLRALVGQEAAVGRQVAAQRADFARNMALLRKGAADL